MIVAAVHIIVFCNAYFLKLDNRTKIEHLLHTWLKRNDYKLYMNDFVKCCK